ncbi:DeoR/GlpR family DNA-binding transcription regulator [Sulfobacillus harzensis]|uniref:DeoR/GlpR transcriptional regulator n=1 Tax=Sulfobacillus harzensis TaxID=2729629 RepID=A0A7Y0L157_9FIRM|nr:DeoR/GlpR family DNA-binding transcription regulator [Sulfobacillus harzensis]NMP21389.1 DeoR/GlpR transcriptional regulator [Sulfobacillus harzensis]
MRQDDIVDMLLRETQISVKELAERFNVSPMTIYRDLQALEERNLVIRTSGGAIIRPNLQYGRGWAERLKEQPMVKQALGAKTAQLLEPHQVVIFDAGTTVLEVARRIPNDLPLTAITNSLPAAAALGEKERVQVLVTAGEYRTDTASLLGHFTTDFLEQLNADVVVLSAAVVNVAEGLSNFSVDSVAVKRTMIARARQVILVTDFSKFQQSALITVAPLESIDVLVSDDRMPEDMQDEIRQRGVRLILVPYEVSPTKPSQDMV